MDPDTLAGSPAVAADHSKVARGSRADPAGMARSVLWAPFEPGRGNLLLVASRTSYGMSP